jgi:hypothetical protein
VQDSFSDPVLHALFTPDFLHADLFRLTFSKDIQMGRVPDRKLRVELPWGYTTFLNFNLERSSFASSVHLVPAHTAQT